MLTFKKISHYTRIIIRIIVCLVIGFQFINTHAQDFDTDQRISVSYNSVELEKVLDDLTKQTGIRFSYNPEEINASQPIHYSAKNKKLIQVLDDLFVIAGLSYSLVGGYLVLKKAPETDVLPEESKAKKYTISGFVIDSENNEALIGAAVFNPETGLGTLTNNYGYFSLTLPEGSYTLETSYLGYDVASKKIELYSNQKWNINLQQLISTVEEVVITSVEREEHILSALPAQIDVKPVDIKSESAVFGETDLLKSLDNLPGISFQSDGSSYFYVRGGNRDQNLILLDEAPLFNPSHMLGLFTPIIPDAVKTATIFKAGIPVEYGGRLSSVIDVRTRDGNKEQFSGSATMGLASTRICIEGPIKRNASSYFLSYRRSYFGWLFKAANAEIQDFFFTDLTTKFNIKLSDRDRLFVTFYYGRDKFLNNTTDDLVNGLEWGNSSLTVRWNHVFGDRLFANTTFYSSNYEYFLHTDFDRNYKWTSNIRGVHLKSEFTWYLNPQNKVKFGIKYGGNFFNPGNYNSPGLPTEMTVSEINSGELILYAGNEQKLSENLILHYGLRFTNWADYGEAFIVNYENYSPTSVSEFGVGENFYSNSFLEPRLALSYKTGIYSSVKASYTRSIQNIHLINNSLSPFNSLEVWLPSGPNIKPQKSDIYNLGYIQAWPSKSVELSTDLFYKRLYNQIGYSYHAELLLNPLIEGELRQGDGSAYGFELSLKKTQGRFSGQISYAFTRSLLQIEGLNGNRKFKAKQDKPVDFSLSLGYYLKPRWLLSGNYALSSGLMTTTPTGFYTYRGSQVPIYTEQNNDRLPRYSRFDIGSDWRLNKDPYGRVEHHLILSFYNFFNSQNAAFLYFTKTKTNEEKYLIPADKLTMQEQVPTYRYIFSIVPSITYYLKF